MGVKAEREKRVRRSNYEFPNSVLHTVLNRSGGTCESCEVKPAMSFHHVTSIASAIAYGYDPEFIRSVDNCLHVCNACHEILDENA